MDVCHFILEDKKSPKIAFQGPISPFDCSEREALERAPDLFRMSAAVEPRQRERLQTLVCYNGAELLFHENRLRNI